jgi:hypothetical protein
MNTNGMITMTMREVDWLKVIQAIVEMGLKPDHAAERLGLTVRQVERLMTRYCGDFADFSRPLRNLAIRDGFGRGVSQAGVKGPGT